MKSRHSFIGPRNTQIISLDSALFLVWLLDYIPYAMHTQRQVTSGPCQVGGNRDTNRLFIDLILWIRLCHFWGECSAATVCLGRKVLKCLEVSIEHVSLTFSPICLFQSVCSSHVKLNRSILALNYRTIFNSILPIDRFEWISGPKLYKMYTLLQKKCTLISSSSSGDHAIDPVTLKIIWQNENEPRLGLVT